jgi:hypothetical protein
MDFISISPGFRKSAGFIDGFLSQATNAVLWWWLHPSSRQACLVHSRLGRPYEIIKALSASPPGLAMNADTPVSQQLGQHADKPARRGVQLKGTEGAALAETVIVGSFVHQTTRS